MINIHEAITKVMGEFKENPLIIHSEADIQARIFNALLSQEIGQENRGLIETKYELNNKKLKTNRVHCEYQGGKEKAKLLDIVVFSKKGTERIKHDNHKLYNMETETGLTPCEALIEIKFENGSNLKPKDIIDDFTKLQEAYEMHKNHNEIKPELYFVYFVFYWTKTQVISSQGMSNILKSLPELSEKGGVNTYLAIGPKNIWSRKIEDLNLNLDKIHLEYTTI